MNNYLKQAQLFCEENKYRFTLPRQQVLETIINRHKPISAYDILRTLSVEKEIKPPTIYRAIDFWSKHGFIHRVESLNCYIACNADHQHKGIQILICDSCGSTKETCLNEFKIPTKIKDNKTFLVKTWNLEIHGLCANCS